MIFNGINSWKKTLHATMDLNYQWLTNFNVPDRAPPVSRGDQFWNKPNETPTGP
jgi:hypothetical protein